MIGPPATGLMSQILLTRFALFNPWEIWVASRLLLSSDSLVNRNWNEPRNEFDPSFGMKFDTTDARSNSALLPAVWNVISCASELFR